ncbi:D-alanyl-D-alanine carboxypeptidase / D-alanyl-D-alanine-endopeptidase (penicillin-binding protein 4) [Tessaracoccus oleiagri]|uniref:D-alanyl-D-alanine carboxypeptidase / D-alanyl-D-alanine-endopeptidase (Penicillin-binding protein 4) n=1 Tax=Tessaracoccus oleiagri TaxID=686624 RepID=A0A1G9MXN4_9ACTN|nr:D-alanyl-D-alanine carboxypeptidase / D-alanyl-D-alanine-endopeptidase (penicillin-binding protein 4) [Tessaracoccus oleiagri]
MPKSRGLDWAITGLIVALLLAGGIVAAALHRPILTAAGLENPGGEPTIAPTMFVEPTPEPEPVVEPDLAPPPPLPPGGPAPDPAVLQQRLAALDTSRIVTADGSPAAIAYEILDAATGEVLAGSNAAQPLIPASNTKTLTAVAVMNAFDGDERFATRVVAPDPSTIVLVGGGDPLLRVEPVSEGAYPAPASLRALAEATAAALREAGTTTVSLGYDASLFEGDGWAPTWPESYRDQVTPITALWADEGRVDGARSRTPALAAAQLFAGQLAELGVTVTGEPAAVAGSGRELARVESEPVHVLVEQAMLRSNNSFTELLGFQLAARTGHPTTFAGSTAAIAEQLTELGLWEDTAHLDDASGLSRSNVFSAGLLARANLHLLTTPRLTAILDGLPVAGVTGTLADRFSDPVSSAARGVARAKTGTLSFVSSLAGTTVTSDGALVVYAVLANGQVSGWDAKVWEDQVVGVLTGCGC